MNEFNQRNTQVIGISIDSQFSHSAWRKTPVNEGGIGAVHYPLVADVNHHICQSYGVEHPTAHIALRASFLIDKQGIVRWKFVEVDYKVRATNDMILQALAPLP